MALSLKKHPNNNNVQKPLVALGLILNLTFCYRIIFDTKIDCLHLFRNKRDRNRLI